MKVLVTGSAGFIGSSLVVRLLQSESSVQVFGLDSLNNLYDKHLVDFRMNLIESEASRHPGNDWHFIKGDITRKDFLEELFEKEKFDIVVNFAAQAGVRYSIDNPGAFIENNIIGFYNILEACRHNPVGNLVFASSSSVYGETSETPFSESDRTDNPVSLYAATKKSDELLAHAYSKLYGIPCTGLRFFTVYGPAGRPDMAYFSFTDKLVKGEKIKLFNYGNCLRDFTYIDDIVEGIMRVVGKPQSYAIYNIGASRPEKMMDFITILKEELVAADVLPEKFDIDSHIELLPMQPGDVTATFASTAAFEKDFGFKPSTSLRDGLRQFARWYKRFNG